jgi:hypothetical protein
VVVVLPDRITALPPYVAVIEELPGKFEPLIMTESPTCPLVGLSATDAPCTVKEPLVADAVNEW